MKNVTGIINNIKNLSSTILSGPGTKNDAKELNILVAELNEVVKANTVLPIETIDLLDDNLFIWEANFKEFFYGPQLSNAILGMIC